jgi:hypothetical protein
MTRAAGNIFDVQPLQRSYCKIPVTPIEAGPLPSAVALRVTSPAGLVRPVAPSTLEIWIVPSGLRPKR